VNGLCITDLCTGDVLGTSEDEGPCCSIVLHSFKTRNTEIESSCTQTKSYATKISFSSENRILKVIISYSTIQQRYLQHQDGVTM